MKKVLITGGAGFIGSEIVYQLFAMGDYDITVLDAMTEQIHGSKWKNSFLYNRIKEKCKFYQGDVSDYEIVEKLVPDNDYIIHLAAETGTGQSMYQINRYNEVNIMGLSNIFQAISSLGKDNCDKKIILSSSRAVYGEGKYMCSKCGIVFPKARSKENMLLGDYKMHCNQCGEIVEPVGTSEDSVIAPNSLYAFTKYTQECMIHTMCDAMNIDYTIFRFQNVYGVGQSLINPYTGILSIFSSLMLDNKTVNIFEDGMESRDFINVIDIAKAVIDSIKIEESNGKTINMGSGTAKSVIEIANLLKKIYQSKSNINVSGNFRIGDIAHNYADISVAREILNFKQTISLEDGLALFCNWVLGEDKDNSKYEYSLNEMEAKGMYVKRNNKK